MRYLTTCKPLILGGMGLDSYTLTSPWSVIMELEPVFWGEGDMLMFSGAYLDPVRGFRFKAKLSTPAIDGNDWGILSEFRRASRPFMFYPHGLDRPGWRVYNVATMHRVERDTPDTVPHEAIFIGTEILSVDATKSLGIIIDLAVEVSGTGPWVVTATWLPMITAGNLIMEVWDTGGNVDMKAGHISIGKLRLTTENLVTAPVEAVFTHNLSPYNKGVLL